MARETWQFQGWRVVAGLFVILMFTVGLVINCFGFFFKPISDELHFKQGQFSLTMSVLAISGTLAAIAVGKLINRLPIRLLATVSAVIYVAGYILYSRCSTLHEFYVVSAIVGFGLTGLCALAPQIVANWFWEKQGVALAIAMAGSGVGGIVFNPLNNWLIINYGWRVAFASVGALAAIAILPITALVLRLHPAEVGLVPFGQRADGAANAAVTYGLTLKEAVKGLPFWGLCLVNLIAMALVMGVQVHVPAYLQSVGLTSTFVAMTMAISNAVLIVGKFAFGALYDKFGPKRSVFNIFAVYFASLFCLARATSAAPAVIFGVAFGFAAALTTMALPLWTVAVVGNAEFALISSITAIFSVVGIAVGTPLAGVIYDTTGSYSWAWSAFAIIAVVGLLTSYLTVRKGVTRRSPAPEQGVARPVDPSQREAAFAPDPGL